MKYYNQHFDGVFWIRGKSEQKLIATLFINEKGIGTISSLQSFENGKDITTNSNEIELILGYINCHFNSLTYSIKLYNAYKSHQTVGPLNKIKYTSHNVLISPVYDENINNDLYNTLMLSSNLISNWVPITGFKLNSNIGKVFEINHFYKQPKSIELFQNEDINVSIYFRASTILTKRRESNISENVFLNIEVYNSFSIKELTRIKKSMERFFNLILFKPFISSIIELKSESQKTYKVIKKSNKLDTNLGKAIDFNVFVQNSHDIFSNWLEKQDKLELAILNFFSVYGRQGVLVEYKFLTYISILENYHKNHISKNANLKTRLEFLITMSSLNTKIKDINAYVEILKTTRHYHSHLEEKHKNKSLRSDAIFEANYLLEFVIREIFIREIGIKEKLVIPTNIELYIMEINK